MTTRASGRPVRRIVQSQEGELVVEVFDRVAVIRPKGCRRNGPVEVAIPWGSIYRRGILAMLEARQRERKRARKGARR